MPVLRSAALLASLAAIDACTTILVGRKARADGSVMCSHTNDGEAITDARLVRVPARDHAPGARRPVFFSPEDYPRYVGYERGLEAYYPVGGQEPMAAIGLGGAGASPAIFWETAAANFIRDRFVLYGFPIHVLFPILFL